MRSLRRGRRLLGAAAGVALLGAVLWYAPMPYFVLLPGITENLNRIVQVQGGKVPRGKLLMVAVSLERANALTYLYARLTPYAELVPYSALVPPGASEQEYQRLSALEMSQSHTLAKVAALRALGYRVQETGQGALVASFLPTSPARRWLRLGDVIVCMDGRHISRAEQLLQAMRAVRPGASVRLTVRRHGRLLTLRVPTMPDPGHPARALIGIGITTWHAQFRLPVRIHIRTGDISGPSAGLMFSLEIYAQLAHRDLTHGQVIAGTGTIDSQGNVGEIGGVREKVVTVYRAGARVFLVPAGDRAAAEDEARRIGIAGKLRIVPVRTLAQAIAVLSRGA